MPFFRARDYENGEYAQKGKTAEQIVMAFVESHPDIIGIDDLRDVKQMRWYDVDACIRTAEGETFLAEIKSDDHLGVTNNVFFETLRLNLTAEPEHAVKLGWSQRSPARFLLYYAPKAAKLYVCRFDDLRRALQRYLLDLKRSGGTPETKYITTSPEVTTQGILIPMSYCDGIFTVYDMGQPGEAPEPPAWNRNPAGKQKFWAWCRDEKGLDDRQVLEALNVHHLEDFAGDKRDAYQAILTYIDRSIKETTAI